MKAKVKFKTVYLNSIEGIKTAECLKSRGWVIIQTGFDSVTFEKKSK